MRGRTSSGSVPRRPKCSRGKKAFEGKSHASLISAIVSSGPEANLRVVQTSFDEVQGQFALDGRWVAYASNGANHRC